MEIAVDGSRDPTHVGEVIARVVEHVVLHVGHIRGVASSLIVPAVLSLSSLRPVCDILPRRFWDRP